MEDIEIFKKKINDNTYGKDIKKLKEEFCEIIIKYIKQNIQDLYLYTDNILIINKFFNHILNFLLYIKTQNKKYLTNRDNILISGHRGIGKTFLMRNIFKIMNDIFPEIPVLFIDYEISDYKKSNLKNMIFKKIGEKSINDILLIDEVLLKYNKPFVLLADEIQDLYVDSTEFYYGIYEDNISTILEVGKSGLGFGVISGSSSRLSSIVFKKNDYEKKYQSYPNLNDTVFNIRKLKPFREINSIIKYITENLNINYNEKEEAGEIYYNTGGIIGIINSYTLDKTPIEHTEYKNMFIKEISRNLFFNSICNFLYIKNIDSFKKNDYFEQRTITYTDIKEISKRRLITDYMSYIHKLIDLNFLYEKSETQWEFLYPTSIDLLGCYFKNTPTRMELMALEGTLSKWDNKSSAGDSNEYLIKKYIMKWEDFPIDDCLNFKFNNKYISFSKTIYSGNDKPVININNIKKDELTGELFSLTKEEGIDGIMFTYNNNDERLLAHILQIKTGGINESIRLGNSSSTSNSIYYLSMKKRAENGLQKIKKEIIKKHTEIDISIASFTLVTNKKIHDDIYKFINNFNSYKCYIINWSDIQRMLGEEIIEQIGYKNFLQK